MSVFLFCFSFFIFAQETSDQGAIDRSHQAISEGFLWITNQMDRPFATGETDYLENPSQFRVWMKAYKIEGENIDIGPQWRVNLVFPELQKKLRITFERDSPHGSRVGPELSGSDDLNSNSESQELRTGLSYLFNTQKEWAFKAGAGVKVSIPPDPYTRMSGRFSLFPKNWRIDLEELLFWTNKIGFGEQTALNFQRSLTERTLFRFESLLTWLDNRDFFDLTTGPAVYFRISDRRVAKISFKALASNETLWQVYSYNFGITYRQLIYKKWLFYEISPGLSFPRNRDWEETPSIFVKIEAIFGKVPSHF